MAKEAIALHLYDIEKSKAVIPQPIKLIKIQHEKNQSVVMIEDFMPPFRHEIENQAIKNI